MKKGYKIFGAVIIALVFIVILFPKPIGYVGYSPLHPQKDTLFEKYTLFAKCFGVTFTTYKNKVPKDRDGLEWGVYCVGIKYGEPENWQQG